MTGSLVLAAYGGRITPGDLDITPALDSDNLAAIANVMSELDAIPMHDPNWPNCPPLDWHFRWSPKPPSLENLDHLMITTVGALDVVPRLCGTFEALAPSAVNLDVGGLEVLVADPASVLDRLEVRTRKKDLERRPEIERIRKAVESGTLEMVGLDHLT